MNKNPPKKIKVTYNAPVTLTFAILCALILILDKFTGNKIIPLAFSSCGGKSSPLPFDFSSPFNYLRLILHIFGNINWQQLISNFAFILLLGPMIEEKYGSAILILMMSITSLVSGVLNACFGTEVLTGASDIVFMMILLVAFNSFSKNEIPLSFILVVILYIGREIAGLFGGNGTDGIGGTNFSALANIAGGICGSLFAFLATPKAKSSRNEKTSVKDGIFSKRKNESARKSEYGNETDSVWKKLDRKSKARLEEIDSESPRFSSQTKWKKTADKTKPASSYSSKVDETTVVGSIEL